MATTAEQLASVQALIARQESHGAAGHSEGAESVDYIPLKDLYAREESLLRRQRAESGGFSLAQPIE